MRRRVRIDATGAPSRLLHYDPADWPHAKCHPECAYWDAVAQWQRDHPDNLLEAVDGPDAPFHQEWI